jgi:electron transfer flavoprotein beta subunit
VADGDVAALIKVVPTRVEVESLTGQPVLDLRFLGVSAADRAALAVAILLGQATGGRVDVYCVGPPIVEAALLEIAALSTTRTVRVALRGDTEVTLDHLMSSYPSDLVARCLAGVLGDPDYVVAGDHSLDRGSGSVPSRVAERLGYAQALGLLDIDVEHLRATRRLDGGWREEVQLGPRSVVSVEAGAGRLPRAGLGALRSVELELIEIRESVVATPCDFLPYRPAPDVVAAPVEPFAARRAMEVIGALSPAHHREVIEATPDEAAKLIVDSLAAWGYR